MQENVDFTKKLTVHIGGDIFLIWPRSLKKSSVFPWYFELVEESTRYNLYQNVLPNFIIPPLNYHMLLNVMWAFKLQSDFISIVRKKSQCLSITMDCHLYNCAWVHLHPIQNKLRGVNSISGQSRHKHMFLHVDEGLVSHVLSIST